MRENMELKIPNEFIASPLEAAPDEDDAKKLFGIELAKDHPNAFHAALEVFPENTSKALWVSSNWLNDPIVIASRDLYLKILHSKEGLLDKNQLAAKALQIVDAKHPSNDRLHLYEAKDRIAALKLYGELAGYIGKTDIDASTKNFTHNSITIKFVKPDKQENTFKTIDEVPLVKPLDTSPLKVKLVSSK